MEDAKQVMSWLEGLAEDDWRIFHSESEVQNIAKAALELLKSRKRQGLYLTGVSGNAKNADTDTKIFSP